MIKSLVGYLLRILPRSFLQRISKPFFYVISYFYKGNKVICPICERQFSTFFPYGRVARENALCTNCLSLERHRFLYLFLRDVKKIFNKKIKILHIAPEICFIEIFKKNKNFRYLTADLESPLADIKMDVHKIPFENNYFDIILCNHVLEHVDNDILVLEEIKRVLKKNGFGILTVPFYKPIPKTTFEDKKIISQKDREKYYGQSDHLRRYGKDIKKRFETSGLNVELEKAEHIINKNLLKRYGIINDDIIISVFKNSN
tara:strand:+ start:340 stop:1116 length:777 start_codon:yes stop_codon:yes gene_type:complete